MEYLTLLGEPAYTESAARKIEDLINKSGVPRLEEVSAVYVHYAHLKESCGDSAKVSYAIFFTACL
jgi:hypothetical protein